MSLDDDVNPQFQTSSNSSRNTQILGHQLWPIRRRDLGCHDDGRRLQDRTKLGESLQTSLSVLSLQIKPHPGVPE